MPVKAMNCRCVSNSCLQIRLELQNFAGDGTRDFLLLHALGIFEFAFAELQHFAVVEPQRRHADQQQSAQDDPKDA